MSDLVKSNAATLPISNLGEMQQAGDLIAKSGMLGASTPAEGFLIVATCLQEKISFLKFNETYHIIQGRLSMKAETILANLHELGGTHEIIERSPDRAAIKVKYKAAEFVSDFSWEAAKQEKYIYCKDGKTIKDNWSTPRGRMQMLWARVVSDGVRAVCPLATRGTYTPEEVIDFADQPPKAGIDNAIRVNPGEVRFPGQPVTAEPEVIDAETTVEVNGSVCPIGKTAGKKWSELDDNVLAYFADPKHPQVKEAMLQEHRLAVHEELKKRGIKK